MTHEETFFDASLREAISGRAAKTPSARHEASPEDPLLRIEQRLGRKLNV